MLCGIIKKGAAEPKSSPDIAMNWRLIRIVDVCLGIPLVYLCSIFHKVFRRASSGLPDDSYRRVLTVKFWGVGNLYMMLPSVYALREKRLDCNVDLLTLKGNREAAETSLFFDSVYTIDTDGVWAFVRSAYKTMFELRARGYDLVIDFEQFARFSALVSCYIGRDRRWGFGTRGQHRHYLFTTVVPYDNGVHVTRSFHSLVEIAGVGGMKLPVPFLMDTALGRRASSIMRRLRISVNAIPVVVMHVGTSANFPERRWPAAYFARVADELIHAHGARILFTGLGEEVALVADVISRMAYKDMAEDISGRLGFRDLLATIWVSDIVISADTATVHLASVLGTPVVGLYGPNTPELYGPWGRGDMVFYSKLPCSPCITNFNGKINTCRHPDGRGACMKNIFPEDVLAGIEKYYFARDSEFKIEKSRADASCDEP